jgi:hypothetical protein
VATRAGGACLAAVLPDISGTGLFVTGEFLWMKPVSTGPQYALVINESWCEDQRTETDDSFTDVDSYWYPGKAHNLEYDWAPGFRAGLGYRLPHDGWEVGALFTYYQTDASEKVGVPEWTEEELDDDDDDDCGCVQYIIPGPMWNGDSYYYDDYERAEAKSELDLYILDIELARRFKVSDMLNLKVSAGPRLLWLKQETTGIFSWDEEDSEGPPGQGMSYYHLERDTAKSKVDYFGAGVKIGAEGEMLLGQGFSIVAKAAGSAVVGEFDHTASMHWYEQTNIGFADEFSLTYINQWTDSEKSSYDRVLPIIELGMGVAWEKKINDKLNFRIKAGYEFMQIFNAPNISIYNKNEDLTLHGLSVQLRFDF